jgi:hypothetical protein
MAMEADFSCRRKTMPPALPRERERDDGHLIKPIGPSADIALFEQLVRIVNEAQERDTGGVSGEGGKQGNRDTNFEAMEPKRCGFGCAP